MSLNTSAVLAAIVSLEAQLAALKAQLGVKSAAPSGKSASVKEPKEKKERAPTEWLLFTERIRALLKDNGYDKKDLGGPALLSFCKTLKTENSELSSWDDSDVLARRADWTVPERKKKSASETSSVVSGGAAAAGKPKKEKKEKKEKKAKKSAPSADEAAPASDAEESTTSSQKKRGPKPLSEMTPEERSVAEARNKAAAEKRKATVAAKKAAAAEAPSSPVVVGLSNAAALPLPSSPKSETSDFKPVVIKDAEGRPQAYFVNLETGHAYHRTDKIMGDWAGLFHKTGGGPNKKFAWIDTAVPAPLSALEELD